MKVHNKGVFNITLDPNHAYCSSDIMRLGKVSIHGIKLSVFGSPDADLHSNCVNIVVEHENDNDDDPTSMGVVLDEHNAALLAKILLHCIDTLRQNS